MRARIWAVLGAWAWCWCWAQALQRPICPADPRCTTSGNAVDENTFYVDGQVLYVKLNDGGYMSMTCRGNLTLDHPALPRFETLVRLNHVKLFNCPPPQHSYAGALSALNILPVERLLISDAAGQISRDHLVGLDRVDALALTNLKLAADAFDATPELQRLRLDSVIPPPVEQLPASLKELLLLNTGVTQMHRADFAHFKGLTSLVVRDDNASVSVEATSPLKDLALDAPTVFLDATLPDTLVNVTLYGWGESTPVPWKSCLALETLIMVSAKVEVLPDGWLANCPVLRVLLLDRAHSLTSIAPGALRNTSTLERVSVTRSALTEMPPELLYDAKPLEFLDLSRNHLYNLTVGTFAKTKHLTEINLTNNNLTIEVMNVISTVTSLRVLRLDNNPFLGDACSAGANTLHGMSLLQNLKSLSELSLRNTGLQHICSDWRENMPQLTRLDLRGNRVTYLTFADVQFEAEVTVDLRDNNVTQLLYSHRDFVGVSESAARCARASRATVLLAGALLCDCRTAWAALALRACPAHVRLRGARCARHALAAAPLDELACDVGAARCGAPAPCRCSERARAAPPRRVLRLACERAGLARLPALPRADVAWELRLAHNRIAAPRAADLPPDLLELDLRNNSISQPDTAAALLAEGRRVLLANNSLQCECGAEPALARLRALEAGAAPACGGGAALREPARCGASAPGALLAAVLAPLLLAAAVLGAGLARPAWRARLKAALRGRRAEAEADERPYDVFLSFSHHDRELVRGLLARLEGGARPYRVCVHYRDWAPGGWIPAQIAASVRRSRRTLAVVSEHFLRSAWARAEFREAYGAALRDAHPRLVVVLLAEPARLPLDAELRRYVAANTYVLWGDPWFWPKLRAALPPPRGRAAPAPPAALGPPAAPPAPGAEPLMLQLSPRTLEAEAGASPASTEPLMSSGEAGAAA